LLEVFVEDVFGAEEVHGAGGVGDGAVVAFEDDAVEAHDDALDFVAEAG
jgi:hypothetical protein